MLLCTTWKARPITPEQSTRMMETWGKLEAELAENSGIERVCWYMNGDGAGGFTVVKANDVEAATLFGLETNLVLSEFLDLESKIVFDLDTAMPAIMKAMERVTG
jgi:hypothetical protein